MKKILALSALMVSIGFGGLPISANAAESNSSATSAAAGEPQVWRTQTRRNRDRNIRNNRSRVRTITQTRIVRRGNRTYRETYQIRYLPNGRTRTRLISRVPVGSRIYNQGRIYNNRATQSYIQTRIVYSGGRRYRETYRVTQYANGRTQTRLISRVRIR